MNQTTIAGHLGADPEVRFTSSGKKVTTLRVAARARRTSKEKDETIWWKVTVWGEEFDKMMPYFKKGSAIIVLGELNKPEIFTDREGRPQISMSLTACSLLFSPFGRSEPGASSASPSHEAMQMPTHPETSQGQGAPQEFAAVGQGKIDIPFNEDEIPF